MNTRLRTACAAAALGLALPASAATYTVAKFTDDTDTSNPASLSLRAAVILANQNPGADTIQLPPGTYTLTLAGQGETAAATGDLDILDDLSIVGAGGDAEGDPAATIVQAGTDMGNGIDRVFNINPLRDRNLNVSFKALTVRHGRMTDPAQPWGGGILAAMHFDGKLEIYNCVIESNTVSTYDPAGTPGLRYLGTGGGLLAYTKAGPKEDMLDPRLHIEKSIFRDNVAGQTGGGFYADTFFTLELLDSVIEGNTAGSPAGLADDTYMYGGGANIGIGQTNDNSRSALVRNVTVAGNTAYSDGGGLVLGAVAPLTVDHVTVSGNRAYKDGGGLWLGGENADLRHVTITGNRADADGTGTGAGGGLTVNTSHPSYSVVLRNSIVAGNWCGTGSTADDVADWTGSPTGLNGASARNIVGTQAAGMNLNAATNLLGADPRLAPLADNGGRGKTHALLADSPALDAGDNALIPAGVTTDQRGLPRVLDAADADPAATVDIGALEMFPVVQQIAAQSAPRNTATQVPFNVGGAGYAPYFGGMTLTATSDNQAIVPDSGLAISGTDKQRTLSITPGSQLGSATITLTASAVVNGKTLTATSAFTLDVVPDTVPDPFSFTPQTLVLPLGAAVTSDAITVTGIDTPSAVSISQTAGVYGYRINGVDCAYSNGSVVNCPAGHMAGNGDTVTVFHRASAAYGGTVTSTLTIGGVEGGFSSTTDQPPAAPTGVAAAPGGGSGTLLVTWTEPAPNGGSAVASYLATASPGAQTCTAPAGTAQCTITGLAGGTAQTVTVAAINGGGLATPSAGVLATPVGAPGIPTGVTTQPGDARVRVAWAAPASDGGSPLTGYEVSASPGGGACSAAPAETECTVAGLDNGTAYAFTVRASNALGHADAAPVPGTPATLGNSAVPLPGGGTAAVVIGGNPPGCTLSAPITIDQNAPAGYPAGARLQQLGVLHFAASGCAGATLAVQVTYPAGALVGLAAYKYGPPAAAQPAAWFRHGSVSGDTVRFAVEDNGAGDNDPASGAIADPLLLAPAPGGVGIPTLSQWGLLLLSALLGLAVLHRKVSSKKCL